MYFNNKIFKNCVVYYREVKNEKVLEGGGEVGFILFFFKMNILFKLILILNNWLFMFLEIKFIGKLKLDGNC